MKQYFNPERTSWSQLIQRPTASYDDLYPLAIKVFNAVKEQGDQAVSHYTKAYDKVNLEDPRVSIAEIEAAKSQLNDELKNAIIKAKGNIERFHDAQKTTTLWVETQIGVSCWQEKRPIQDIGLYIPGGSAPLFSTILMLAIPAKIAGCRRVVLCSPPDKEGKLPKEVLYTAALCGITEIFKVGGMQAIAAMTFGTETIPKVFKIFGPGNQYVTVAKQLATQYQTAIDMPAGPSELLIVADHTAKPSYLAADLLSQAEHGADSQVILVTTNPDLFSLVVPEINRQLTGLARREIAKKAIDNSKLIYFDLALDAADFINLYGPEHYIICVQNEDFFLEKIENAGSIFVGNFTPESAGDYASGTNHTLPTNGYTKQYSGVNLDSFLKQISFQKISPKGLLDLGPSIEYMAEAEGLQAHKNAITLRLNDLKNDT